MPTRIVAATTKDLTLSMEISEEENTISMQKTLESKADSDNEGSVLSEPPDVEEDNAPTPRPTNGARSVSSSTAREEGTPAADGGRRKSGRVIRKPRKLVDELPPASTAPTKRKRPAPHLQEEDTEMQDASGADDESSEDEAEDSAEGDDSPDEEELREKRRKTKKKGSQKKGANALAKAPAAKKIRMASGAVATTLTRARRSKKSTGANGASSKKGKAKGKQRDKGGQNEGEVDNVLFGSSMILDTS